MTTPSIYKAEVVEASNRNIIVTSPHLVNCDIEVKPLLDGLIKCSVPDVGDQVWIVDPYGTGTYRRYLPVDATFSSLSDNPDDTEIESKNGNVRIDGGTIYLGEDATDWIALSSKVSTELDRIKADLDSLKLLLVAHTHAWPPGSGILTQPDDTTLPGFTPTPPGSVASSKTKSE